MALIKCKDCGMDISDAAAACPHCGAPVSRDTFCTSCGTLVPDGASFCPGCGASVSSRGANDARTAVPAPKVDLEGKDRVTTAILALLIGGLGVHYFYLGKVTGGFLTILLTFCTCGMWGFILLVQAILMLTMSDADFAAKYVKTDKTFPLF
ncbi:MAG: TM2 domain-containing protein [Bacteroidales bacterium]|nr:TM2 domain-containing protein [Bacteroidales bacterium]